MADSSAKGIHGSPLFKLGKAAAQPRTGTPKFRNLMRANLNPPPATYDFDSSHPGIPLPMFANDVLGCCVISGRAHQTLRFEDIEQLKVVRITDKDITREYFRQTNGADSGLVVVESLDEWRTRGWRAARRTYSIRGYAELDYTDADEVRLAIFSDVGIGIGVQLPSDASRQINTGQAWDVTTGPGSRRGSWGGHYVYLVGYTPEGPVCITWGRKQQMTWAWLAKYGDEAYAVFDAQNRFRKEVVDQEKVDAAMLSLADARESA
jgi:hypothetical protein